MTRVAYVRKTTGVRREPGGLERAVLMLVGDGCTTSLAIAEMLGTSIDNVNGALGRLERGGSGRRSDCRVPIVWDITAHGRLIVSDEGQWT
ncbi:MAG: hypothetical protein J7521_20285 [Caulobacter sp.]|nr:hypothetical protein [Caulobacter sp.]